MSTVDQIVRVTLDNPWLAYAAVDQVNVERALLHHNRQGHIPFRNLTWQEACAVIWQATAAGWTPATIASRLGWNTRVVANTAARALSTSYRQGTAS